MDKNDSTRRDTVYLVSNRNPKRKPYQVRLGSPRKNSSWTLNRRNRFDPSATLLVRTVQTNTNDHTDTVTQKTFQSVKQASSEPY